MPAQRYTGRRVSPRRIVLYLVLSCWALESLSAAGVQEVPLGRSRGFEGLNELRQSVARLQGGGYAVVWEKGRYPERGVRLQYVRLDGSVVFSDDGLTLGSSQFDDFSPVVLAHPRSGVFVAFLRQSRSGGGGGRVLVQWIDSQGRRRWPGGGVAAVEPFDDLVYFSEARLLAGPARGAYLCYMSNRFDTPDSTIGCQRFSATGERLWSNAGRKAGGEPGWQILPVPVSDGAGGLLVVWRNQRQLWDDQVDPVLVEGQRFAPDGSRLWGDGKLVHTTRVAEMNSYIHAFHAAVPDGRGGAVLAIADWSGSGEPSWDVLAQRVSAEGELLWGEDATVALDGPREQQISALVTGPDGGAFLAVWEVLPFPTGRLLLFRLGADGQHAWSPQGVALSDPAPRALDFGAYASFDDGVLRVAWTHQIRPATWTFNIHFARFDGNGERLASPVGPTLTTAPNGQFLRGLVFDRERRQGFAAWEDRRRGEEQKMDVYGAIYSEK